MISFQYKVVPAPSRGLRSKGLKTTEDRFAHALETAMNDLGADGWEYLRADTLPCQEREGLMGKTTNFQNVLVFRRTKVAAEDAPPDTADAAPAGPPLAAIAAPALLVDHRAESDGDSDGDDTPARTEPPVTAPPAG